MLDNFEDLKVMCKKFKVEGISEKLTVFTDNQDFMKTFFDKDTKNFLA